jgi:hypothetical protein
MENAELFIVASTPIDTATPLPDVLMDGLLIVVGNVYSASVLNSEML